METFFITGSTLQKRVGKFCTIKQATLKRHIIYGLHPYYHYQYQLTAFTGAGHGPYSPPNSIQLPQDGRYYAWSWTTIIFSFCCAHYHDSYTSSINMQFLVRILFNSMSLLELSQYHGYLPSLSIGMGKSLAM